MKEQRIGVQVFQYCQGHCAATESLPFSLGDVVLNLEIEFKQISV